MMPDRVAFLDDAANDLRVALDLLADEKEGRGHAFALEDIQQAGRMFRIGAVVEGQTHRAAAGRAAHEQTPPRQYGFQGPAQDLPDAPGRDPGLRRGGMAARNE